MPVTSVLNFDCRRRSTGDQMIAQKRQNAAQQWDCNSTQIIILPRSESRAFCSQLVLLFFITKAFCKPEMHPSFLRILNSLIEFFSFKLFNLNNQRTFLLFFLASRSILESRPIGKLWSNPISHFLRLPLPLPKWDTPSTTLYIISSLWWFYVSRLFIFQSFNRPSLAVVT